MTQGSKTYPQIDHWVWGTETILWGFDPEHQYTFKVLAPKKGKEGCLSLQYHNEKSETWFQFKGLSWALVVVDESVCTRVLKPGDVQTIPKGAIHRLMGLSDDCQVLEPSTPDKHAADKSVQKDVIRLHCYLGREAAAPRTEDEKKIVQRAIDISNEAIKAVERGELPQEIDLKKLLDFGGTTL